MGIAQPVVPGFTASAMGDMILTPATTRQAVNSAVIDTIIISGISRTREEVVKRELLFSVGDVLDSSLVAESARNLRRLRFLGDAHVQAGKVDGMNSILVEVEDLYSRAVSPEFGGTFDELNYGVIAVDYNFLGRGQTAQLSLHHNAVSGQSAAAFYRNPRLAGSRFRVTANVEMGSEGYDHSATASHPFRALSTRWASGISLFTEKRIRRLYDDRNLAARYVDRLDGASFWVAKSAGKNVKLRPSLRLDVTDRSFATTDPTLPYVPEDRQRVLPNAGLLLWQPRFEKSRFVRNLGPVEDLQMGSWVSVDMTLSQRALGSDRTFRTYRMRLAPRLKPHPDLYVLLTLLGSTRHGTEGYTDRRAIAQARAYFRVLEKHSVAMRLRWDALANPEDSDQLLLGVLRGLRGYSPRRFDGSRRLLFNIEARPTIRQHSQFVLAGALFADAGAAWTPGQDPVTPRQGYGAGLRLGLPRIYNTPILRADLAYGVADNAWQFFMGMRQYF